MILQLMARGDACMERHTEMNFVVAYTKAETLKDKVMCLIAKFIGANYVTPLGRIIILQNDYNKIAHLTGNDDLI